LNYLGPNLPYDVDPNAADYQLLGAIIKQGSPLIDFFQLQAHQHPTKLLHHWHQGSQRIPLYSQRHSDLDPYQSQESYLKEPLNLTSPQEVVDYD
jgi:hypothetical protein